MSEDGKADSKKGRINVEPRLWAMIESVGDVPWFHVAHLKQGDILEVKTKAGIITDHCGSRKM